MILAGFHPTAVLTRVALAAVGACGALGILVDSARGALSDPQRCQVPETFVTQTASLPRVALKRLSDQPLRIVAIGSSSTSGAGASSPQHSYPAQLAAELAHLWPQAKIEVVNRGIGGERSHQMLARFAGDVLAEKPDLVIWQIGTNGTLRGDPVAATRDIVLEGIDSLQRNGIDVILMTPQFAPRFNEKADHLLRVAAIRSAARERDVGVFRRYEIMQRWIKDGRMTFATMLSPDGLHLNDLSYGCVAHLLAMQIDHASRDLPTIAISKPVNPAPNSPVATGPVATGPVASGVSVTPVMPQAAPAEAPISAPGVTSVPVPTAAPIRANTRF